MNAFDLKHLSIADLLKLSSGVLTELNDRKVLRSRNSPTGDLGEYLTQRVLGGKLEDNSAKSWDLLLANGQRVQIKARTGGDKNRQWSPFRSWDFDSCVFVTFHHATYEVISAIQIPRDSVIASARHVPWVGPTAHRVGGSAKLEQLEGAEDLTIDFRSAMQDN